MQGKSIAFVLALAFITACGPTEEEAEQACFDKISADFDSYADLASAAGDYSRAVLARESSISALVIKIDDDRSICDYVTAGARLERK